MKRILAALILGFVAALAWLVLIFLFADPRSTVRFMAFGPADYIQDHVLPAGAAAAFYGKESQWAHHTLSIWLSIVTWWLPSTIGAWLLLRRLGPNNSFKPTPLRG
jgi:hypothetical protein